MKPIAIGLMATKNRPEMAHRAAHLFCAQTYPNKRLVVFDDGDAGREFFPCATLLAAGVEVHVAIPTSLPAKRNQMVRHVLGELSAGAIGVLWDDDDYHGPRRIERQVAALDASPTANACLFRPFDHYDQIRHELRRTSHGAVDATLAFRRKFWDDRQWDEEVDPGSGWRMVVKRRDVVHIDCEHDDGVDYVVVWHGAHRLAKPDTGEANWGPSFRHTADDVSELLRMPDCGC